MPEQLLYPNTRSQAKHVYTEAELDERYVVVKGGLFEGVTVKRVGTPKDVHIGDGLTSFHVQPIPDRVIPGWGNPVASDKNIMGKSKALRDILGPVRVAKNEELRQQRVAAQGA